jgi:uncharacterized protein (TIGR04141 family)
VKLNIFSIPSAGVSSMKRKFADVGLREIHVATTGAWSSAFYFSDEQEPADIPWVATFAEYFGKSQPQNLIYFGAYVFEQTGKCFVLTFGKSHFYVRPYCDHDFGIEVAKRVADEGDIKQKASKKFAGRRKKEIRSYTSNTRLDIESGESVDYLQAAVLAQARPDFGKTAKFGSSVLLNPSITKEQIGELLDKVTDALARPPAFALPRTVRVSDDSEVVRYDGQLLDAILGDDSRTEFTNTGHDLVGVDFIFSGNEQFTLTCRGHQSVALGDGDLDLDVLREYIKDQGIGRDEVFGIRVKVENEGQRAYSKTLKESLDYIVDGENVMLSQGRWLWFNTDYIDQLNEYVDGITIEPTESGLDVITGVEGDFNTSAQLMSLGYITADKDFSKIRTQASTPVEAWDLQLAETVYAVKFGTAKKLGYVCDQAIAVLEIIRNNANLKKLDPSPRSYCLWLGFETVTTPAKLSTVNSIILKQKVEAWARLCREVGIEAKLKFSRHT